MNGALKGLCAALGIGFAGIQGEEAREDESSRQAYKR